MYIVIICLLGALYRLNFYISWKGSYRVTLILIVLCLPGFTDMLYSDT